jgi:Domain of unknown function (DUF4394)/Calx-beta domain
MRRAGLGCLVAGATLAAAAPASAEPAVGVLANAGNTLVTFDTASPGSYTSARPITGLQVGEQIVGVDFRYTPNVATAVDPALMKLNAVGVTQNGGTDSLRVYTIDPGTGAATLVSGAPATIDDGTVYATDINHTVDRIRVVNDADASGRLVPDTGALFTDTDLSPAARSVNAIAYDRVDADAATPTTLYGISKTLGSLVTIGGLNSTPSPNLGAVNTIGSLGVGAVGDVAMDISPTGTAFAALDSGLYTLNLTTGAATLVGAAPAPLRGLAIVPPATVAFGATGFTQAENGGAATISLTRGGSVFTTAAVDYTAGDASGRVTFAPGETSKTVSVPVTDDKTDNPDRKIVLSLRSVDALVVAVNSGTTLTITDDDPAPDTKAPKATIKAPPSTTLASLTSKGVKAKITVSEAAKLDVSLEGTPKTAVLSAAYGLTLATKTVSNAKGTKSVTLKPSRKLVGKPRRAFKVRVKVVATDAAGNRSTATRTLTVKR